MNEFDTQFVEDRRRRYGQQAQVQAPQGRMVGNTYIAPNFLEYIAAGLRGAGGMVGEQMAEKELREMQGKKQQAVADALRNFGQQAQGMPADVLPEDQAGPVRPAQAPNMQGAYQALLQAPDQGLRQAGMQGTIQLAQTQAEQARKAAEQQRMMGILQGSTPQQAIAAGVPPDMVKQFYEARNYGRDEVTFQDVGGEKVPVTKFGDRPQGVAPLQKTGNPFSDLVVRGPDGQIVPNAPLANVKTGIAKAGAARTNVSVNMPDKKFYEGLGTAVSGQIEQGFNQAQSAVSTLNNANQIAANLDKAIVGPLANQRIGLARIGEMLGVTGADTKEVLANTRNVIQGLARQELAAAGQMKGQGQITESEREILRRAEAGNVSDFTKVELETFIGAIRKTARSRVATHQRNVERLGQDPQAGTILPYLQLDAPEDVPLGGATQPQQLQGGFRVIR